MALSETAKYVDGPTVYAWLRARGVEKTGNAPSIDRRLREWKNGTRAIIWTVDEVFTALGFHIRELPDTAFRSRRLSPRDPRPKRKSPTTNRLSEQQRQELRERIRACGNNAEIAREFSVDRTTVTRYRQAMSHPT